MVAKAGMDSHDVGGVATVRAQGWPAACSRIKRPRPMLDCPTDISETWQTPADVALAQLWACMDSRSQQSLCLGEVYDGCHRRERRCWTVLYSGPSGVSNGDGRLEARTRSRRRAKGDGADGHSREAVCTRLIKPAARPLSTPAQGPRPRTEIHAAAPPTRRGWSAADEWARHVFWLGGCQR